ncbi:MAG: hypothetical protein J0L66_18490 [Cytophagales bacterium]|nr:hypothetical protein [Cytophagales bacterium]
MRISIASLVFLFFLNSCQVKSALLEGRVTKVTPHYDLNHYDLPHVTFSTTVKNIGNSETSIYVKNYGRIPPPTGGSFWLYYNDEVDSLELFSASCEECYEQTLLKPGDSLNLILQIHYSAIASDIVNADSVESINNEIKDVFDNWNVIRYFDSAHNQLFEAQKN